MEENKESDEFRLQRINSIWGFLMMDDEEFGKHFSGKKVEDENDRS